MYVKVEVQVSQAIDFPLSSPVPLVLPRWEIMGGTCSKRKCLDAAEEGAVQGTPIELPESPTTPIELPVFSPVSGRMLTPDWILQKWREQEEAEAANRFSAHNNSPVTVESD
jgi:hypothetical protein